MRTILKLFIYSVFVCGIHSSLRAGDTLSVFSPEEFLHKVLAHHPLAKQIFLLPEQARMEIRMARGSFDPSINYYLSEKKYAGTRYYTYRGGFLKVPVWPGPELKAGFEQNSGTYINSSDKTPAQGLLYGGLSLPLAQGLLMDQRRADLNKARLGREMAEADLIKEINKLLLYAIKDYWMWMEAWYRFEVLKVGLELAEKRNIALQQGFVQGQYSGLDTMESSLELLRRNTSLQEALVYRENMRLALSLYLWDNEGNAIELADHVRPVSPEMYAEIVTQDSFDMLLNYAALNHPELQKLKIKSEILRVEKSMQREYLKPVINLEYFPLLDHNARNPGGPAPFFQNNYKLGLDIYFPLFLRKARGKLGQINLKLQELEYMTQFESLRIKNNLEQKYNEYLTGKQMLDLQNQALVMSEKLRDGEDERFRNGESTFFMVNTRERNLLDARMKWIELSSKFRKLQAELRWSSGMVLH